MGINRICTGFSQMAGILRPELLDGCDRLNYLNPSKIQAEAIPRCLSNTKELKYPSLIGQAHHGSGKTATFSLIMLQRVDEHITLLQGLVVVHSRELAIQTFNVIRSLGQFIQGLKVGLFVPKERLPTEWTQQIIVGTPGTVIHKVFQQKGRDLKSFLREFRILVVDEADEFLQSRGRGGGRRRRRGQGSSFGGLFEQLRMITNDCQQYSGKPFQTLLFSATFPSAVMKLALEIAPNPVIIKVAQKQVQLDNVAIFKILCVDDIDKFQTMLRVIALSNIGQMIIFVNSIQRAKHIIEGLQGKDVGIACSALFGTGMDPKWRDITMEQFRKNQTQCLVASNVIARGIDVPTVGLVVNFDVPQNAETLMHRVGRTGRFGAKGVAINLVTNQSIRALNDIEKEYDLTIRAMDKTAKAIKHHIARWLSDDE